MIYVSYLFQKAAFCISRYSSNNSAKFLERPQYIFKRTFTIFTGGWWAHEQIRGQQDHWPHFQPPFYLRLMGEGKGKNLSPAEKSTIPRHL